MICLMDQVMGHADQRRSNSRVFDYVASGALLVSVDINVIKTSRASNTTRLRWTFYITIDFSSGRNRRFLLFLKLVDDGLVGTNHHERWKHNRKLFLFFCPASQSRRLHSTNGQPWTRVRGAISEGH